MRFRRQRLLALSVIFYVRRLYFPLKACDIRGFWDRAPKPTAGRLLVQVHFADLPELAPELRKKQSPTAHLPKGVHGHRRQKPAPDPPPDLWKRLIHSEWLPMPPSGHRLLRVLALELSAGI